MSFSTQLKTRSLLRVCGPDAESFLDNLVTSELPTDGKVVGSALLSPQGKILFSFLLALSPDSSFLVECDTKERAGLLQRLSMYKLRANVELNASDAPVHAVASGGFEDQRDGSLGGRLYETADAEEGAEVYLQTRIAAGVLEGPEEIMAGQDFPHDVGFDLTNAVSFKKGCFVGQEVVSRVKHRGTARRRPVIIQGSSLAVGGSVHSKGRDLGTIRAVSNGDALAVIRIDQVKGSETVADQHVEVCLPSIATYSLGKQ